MHINEAYDTPSDGSKANFVVGCKFDKHARLRLI